MSEINVSKITGLSSLNIPGEVYAWTINAASFLVNGAPLSAPVSLVDNVIVTSTTQTAVKDTRYILTNAASTTLTLPASPISGDTLYVVVANDLTTNVIARNGSKIMGLNEDMTLDIADQSIGLVYVNATLGWRLI